MNKLASMADNELNLCVRACKLSEIWLLSLSSSSKLIGLVWAMCRVVVRRLPASQPASSYLCNEMLLLLRHAPEYLWSPKIHNGFDFVLLFCDSSSVGRIMLFSAPSSSLLLLIIVIIVSAWMLWWIIRWQRWRWRGWRQAKAVYRSDKY